MKVLVFGYSDNPERYSYLAANLLSEYSHEVIKFSPRLDDFQSLAIAVDTITLYVNKDISDKFSTILLNIKCRRIIFNPGTENKVLEEKFKNLGVEVIQGCTLVMLKTSQF
ncbi:MAG: CoA-binding protein [Bacteriovorax sp.]|nr:CoA-binding protein [Bacteriovorax sp.]